MQARYRQQSKKRARFTVPRGPSNLFLVPLPCCARIMKRSPYWPPAGVCRPSSCCSSLVAYGHLSLGPFLPDEKRNLHSIFDAAEALLFSSLTGVVLPFPLVCTHCRSHVHFLQWQTSLQPMRDNEIDAICAFTLKSYNSQNKQRPTLAEPGHWLGALLCASLNSLDSSGRYQSLSPVLYNALFSHRFFGIRAPNSFGRYSWPLSMVRTRQHFMRFYFHIQCSKPADWEHISNLHVVSGRYGECRNFSRERI